uniref:Uncharacterized protein n=1 Tax=Timspurckia oligopyrenoides TaxID=708627 RepID=A0A7S0ZGS9_9RHOD|mmetsp:Transcript_4545/g.7956  ORF Transcript_4545/g.7956 Transcript_4545/m.7956 type:complete len:125 (+) Transcript_4545:630-1004(+)
MKWIKEMKILSELLCEHQSKRSLNKNSLSNTNHTWNHHINHQEQKEKRISANTQQTQAPKLFDPALNFTWGPNGSSDMFYMPKHHLTGSSKKLSDYYTPEQQKRVYKLFEQDQILFRYPYELPE